MSEHPGWRSFLLVVLLGAVTLGAFWFYYLHRMFRAADARRDIPFMAKTFWVTVGLTMAMLLSVILVGLPGLETEHLPWTPTYAPSEDGRPVPVMSGPLSNSPWVTNTSEILIVAAYVTAAAFLFMEIIRFRPPICSAVALPMLLLAHLPFLFIPGLAWFVLVLDFLTLFALYDLHRGLMAFFDEEPEADEGNTSSATASGA